MAISYKEIDTCRCCGGGGLREYLDLGEQPLANAFHKGDAEQERFPLKVNVCPHCFHSQLSIAVDPAVLYNDYPYVTGVSRAFKDHCRELVRDVVSRFLPRDGLLRPSVLDIGCNDGTLLEEFRRLGCEVTGVDPAQNLGPLRNDKGILVFTEPWSRDVANNLSGDKSDVITSTNSFAHVDDNAAFLNACHLVLADKGVLVIEVPYCGILLDRVEFDTIYHEHLSYFLIRPFERLAYRCNFTIVDVLQTSIHGGSVRFYLKKGGAHCRDIYSLMIAEYESGLHDLAAYPSFAGRVSAKREEIRSMLAGIDGKKVGYGASAKGNVMLNYCGVDLDYIVDDTPGKRGLLTPGRNIPVVGREVLRAEEGPVNILVLPWNFVDEIVGNIRGIRRPDQGDHCMVHCPAVRRFPLFPEGAR